MVLVLRRAAVAAASQPMSREGNEELFVDWDGCLDSGVYSITCNTFISRNPTFMLCHSTTSLDCLGFRHGPIHSVP
jgi:hypothetical protein